MANAHPMPVIRVVDVEETAEFLRDVFGYRRLWPVDVGESLHWLEMTALSDRRSVAIADMTSCLWSYGPIVFVTTDLQSYCQALEFRGIPFQDSLTRLVSGSENGEVESTEPIAAPPGPARARAVEFVDRENGIHLLAER